MREKIDVQKVVASLPQRISGLIINWADKAPDSNALMNDEVSWTYRDLKAAMEVCQDLLRDAGVRAGDRVMLVNENCIELIPLIFAVSQLDAWAVLINARLSTHEIDRIRDHCQPRRILYTSSVSKDAIAHAQRQGSSALSLDRFGQVLISDQLKCDPEPVYESNAEQVAAMIYTSGTTGQPKGVMLTHLNLLYIASISGLMRGLCHTDRVYAVLPLSHVFGLAATFLGTMYAGGFLQLRSVFDPGHLAQAMKNGISVFQGVPAMYAKLLEFADLSGNDLKAPRLRYLSAGGSPLDLDLKNRVEKRFGLALHNGYGLTETSPSVSQTLVDNPRTDDSVGLPLPGIEIRIVDNDGHPVKQGEIGELWVHAKSVMKGYYRDPEQTRSVLTEEGWLKTGDLVRQQEDGNLFVTGRVKELIIRSGFNVYPPEVEAALNTHPEVIHSAVVGRAVPGNEEVIAFVELMPNATITEDELKNHVRQLLAPYKRPSRIIVMDAMPAAATGKVYKHKLSEIAANLP